MPDTAEGPWLGMVGTVGPLILLIFTHPSSFIKKITTREGFPIMIPSAQRLVWAAKQALGKAALVALFA